jgi:hypothetical protein
LGKQPDPDDNSGERVEVVPPGHGTSVPDQNRRDYGEKTDDQGKRREKKNHGLVQAMSFCDGPTVKQSNRLRICGTMEKPQTQLRSEDDT